MKISFSKDFGTINFILDEENYEQDLLNCQRIEKMMQSEEYQVLLTLFLQIKEKFDEVVMKVKPQEQSFRETAIYAARLNGFWEAVKAPTKIVQAYKDFREERIKELDKEIKASVNGSHEFNEEN